MARDVAASPGRVMMSARSTPNLQQAPPSQQHQQQTGAVRGENKTSIYSYLHTQSGLNFAPVVQQQQQPQGDAGSPPPVPPVRDASSLKCIKYGPGHEKFPSWPVSAAAETPQSMRSAPGGGSHRSKSWTDHTNYPKEKGITYTRPYMKRPNPAFTQQLKTVMERCEKIPPEAFEPRPEMLEESHGHLYLPRVDREGKALGDTDYMVPSPPERDIASKPQLTQADLEEYARSYQDPQVDLEEYARSYQEPKPQAAHLTQADLEEYSRTYDEALRPQHQQQQSYAQSEGYHSYVSSTDSITTTPFLDRLRRDSEATARPVVGAQTSWDEHPERERDSGHAGRDSVVTTSSGSASSSETLKWHGSLSDVSVASSSCTHHGSASSTSSKQLIAHSARVQTPQRHHSESVLYLGGGNAGQGKGWQARVQRNNHHNKLRLFPVNTYTVQPNEQQQQAPPPPPPPPPQQQQQLQTIHRLHPLSPPLPSLSVAERISELERQQMRYTYLDPDKRHRVSDPTLKAIQKKALLSFYERHHSANARSQAWRSEPQLAQPTSTAPCPQSPPPQPPPRPRASHSARRASSASDYAGGAWREAAANKESVSSESGGARDTPRHQHSSSCGSLSTDLLGPLIVGPSISVDDWVPERPPKKPHLRAAFPPPVPERLPSPDLPPPSPPTVLEDEVFASDEPLPPPPPELHAIDWPVICPSDKSVSSQTRAERISSQRSTSQTLSSVLRHTDVENQSHVEGSSERIPENGSPVHNDITVEKNVDNCAISPQKRSFGNSTQRSPETTLSPRSSESNVPRLSLVSSVRPMDESNQRSNDSSLIQQKYHKNNSSPENNRVIQRQLENGITPQRLLERGFTLPKQLEDCAIPQKHVDSITNSQRHLEHNIVPQRQREGVSIQKQVNSPTQRPIGNEITHQKYQNGTFQRHHLENGTANLKTIENENSTHRLNDSVHKTQRSIDINISMSRHISSATLSRRQECGAINSKLIQNSSSHQGYSVTSSYRNMNDTFTRTSAIKSMENETCLSSGMSFSKHSNGGRSSFRYPTQKLVVNGKLATPISEQMKQQEGPPSLVKSVDRASMRSSDISINARLQNFARTLTNGENSVPDESTRISKSPPHSKLENDLTVWKQQLEDTNNKVGCQELNVQSSSSVLNTTERVMSDPEQSSIESPAPVSRLTLHNQQSTSKASYLAYRRDRDRGLPNFEGSYKRTMSPSGQEVTSTTENQITECDRVPSAGNMALSVEEEQQRPTSHHHIQAVSSEKKFVVLTSVMDCNSNKELNTRTSDEVLLSSEETQCKVTKLHSPEETKKVLVVPTSVSVNVETETQCDLSESSSTDAQSIVEKTCSSVQSCSPPQSPPPPPPTVQQRLSPQVMESLQLVQRSEVVLRVNAATSDAAIQTESEREVLDQKPETVVSPLLRQKLQEEIECEQLSLDLVSRLPASDKLQGLLVPMPEHKKPTDYVSGLFRLDVTLRPRTSSSITSSSSQSTTVTTTTTTTTTSTATLLKACNTSPTSSSIVTPLSSDVSGEEVRESNDTKISPLSASSAYFTTSESKAKFLTRYGRDMNQSEQLNGLRDNKELQQKKEELMTRLDRKLQVLRGEHLVVTEESRVNDELGESVASQVARLARPHEASKYRLHVEEVGKITSLLLGLSGRLARAENALMGLPHHHTERKILESKRDKLKEQLEEAKKLKENIDRRSVCVSNILYKYFNAEEYADYDHFINMKAKLIMDSREIADKIKLGEEQLAALKETLSAPD